MTKIRHQLTRRECCQAAWLLVAPLLFLALVFARQKFWETPKFAVPPGTQILECRRNPFFGIGGTSYVQRVQSPLSPDEFWMQTYPLWADNPKIGAFDSRAGANRAEIRNQMQRSFRPFGLSQTAPMTAATDGGFSEGKSNSNSINVFYIRNQNGTMIEFWIR